MGILVYIFYKVNFLWATSTHLLLLVPNGITSSLGNYALLPSYALQFTAFLTSQIAHVLFLYLTLTLIFVLLYALFSRYNFVFT